MAGRMCRERSRADGCGVVMVADGDVLACTGCVIW